MTTPQRINAALRRVPWWLVYIVGGLIPFYYLYLGLTGRLGVEPINALERQLGELALIALVIVLAITPLRRWTGVSLVVHRRALGLLAFFYIVCHLFVWLVLDVRDPTLILADIVKRPYITIGMAAFVLSIPVAITSNDTFVRKLGPVRWRRVHKLTYAICALGAAHYVMVGKTWQIEPLVYLLLILFLLATRIPFARLKSVARQG